MARTRRRQRSSTHWRSFPGAPVALTIDERWMDVSDPDGFGFAVQRLLNQGDLEVVERTRFRHRVTTTGEPVFYELLVGRTAS